MVIGVGVWYECYALWGTNSMGNQLLQRTFIAGISHGNNDLSSI